MQEEGGGAGDAQGPGGDGRSATCAPGGSTQPGADSGILGSRKILFPKLKCKKEDTFSVHSDKNRFVWN